MQHYNNCGRWDNTIIVKQVGMYSLKGQFEKFISQHIGKYVEEYDYSTLSVCLRAVCHLCNMQPDWIVAR